MNLAAVVRANAANYGEKAAIRYNDRTISYATLWGEIDAVAGILHLAGVRRGQRVGLALKDHPLHVIAHYAIARLGAVILPLDHRWTGAEKRAAVRAFGPVVVVTDGTRIDGVTTLTIDPANLDSEPSTLPPMPDHDAQELLISLSSGTTGRPKGALVSHDNLFARFRAQWSAIGYGEQDCFAVVTPLFFGAGRSFAMGILAAGGTLRLAPPPLTPEQVVDVLQDSAITATFLPPTLLRRLLPLHVPRTGPLFPNLDYLIVSGEPLHADEARECLDKISGSLYSYYASSEGGGISLLRPNEFGAFAHTVGRPMPDSDVQIVDAEDVPLPTHAVGRLRYRGPGVATRYLDSDGRECGAVSEGWFYPGDLAKRLESGHVVLCGRDKDVIIRGGINVYPAEIESVLLTHPEVVEAAVVGRKDPDHGEIVVAHVAASSQIDTGELVAYCENRLAPYKVPQEFRFLESLPKRPSGKIDKQALGD